MDNRTLEKVEHLLALKVMRLTKPTIGSPIIVSNESKDLPEDILNSELKNDITSVPGSETISAGQFLIIPQSFGSIYLGESFLSYIFVHNDSLQIANDVSVKADLHTASQKIRLPGNHVADLLPEHTIDQIIHHEVKETGTHIIVCEVCYKTPAGEQQSFRKFFKFEVLKPLDITTNLYNAESDEVLLEAQVQNITAGPIHLEKVAFESSDLFKVSSLNSPEESRPGGGLLLPQASRQYLYCLTPLANTSHGTILGSTDIGRLDIVWRSNLGEKGRLQTFKFQTTAPDYGSIRLSVHHVPNIVKIEEPFTFTCKISNLSNRSMDLTLSLEKIYPGLIWIGTSGRRIGTVEVGSSIFLDLTMVPLTAGLHSISGLRLRDTLLGKLYEYDDLAQVFCNKIVKVLFAALFLLGFTNALHILGNMVTSIPKVFNPVILQTDINVASASFTSIKMQKPKLKTFTLLGAASFVSNVSVLQDCK